MAGSCVLNTGSLGQVAASGPWPVPGQLAWQAGQRLLLAVISSR